MKVEKGQGERRRGGRGTRQQRPQQLTPEYPPRRLLLAGAGHGAAAVPPLGTGAAAGGHKGAVLPYLHPRHCDPLRHQPLRSCHPSPPCNADPALYTYQYTALLNPCFSTLCHPNLAVLYFHSPHIYPRDFSPNHPHLEMPILRHSEPC